MRLRAQRRPGGASPPRSPLAAPHLAAGRPGPAGSMAAARRVRQEGTLRPISFRIQRIPEGCVGLSPPAVSCIVGKSRGKRESTRGGGVRRTSPLVLSSRRVRSLAPPPPPTPATPGFSSAGSHSPSPPRERAGGSPGPRGPRSRSRETDGFCSPGRLSLAAPCRPSFPWEGLPFGGPPPVLGVLNAPLRLSNTDFFWWKMDLRPSH